MYLSGEECEVTAMTYPGDGPTPSVLVHFTSAEGSQFTLAFLGRRDIRCMRVGSRLAIEGAVSGRETVYNPHFTVLSQP